MEEVKARTMEDVNLDFAKLAQASGVAQLQIALKQGELNDLLQKMSELNKEAAELKKIQAEHAPMKEGA